MRYAMDIYLIKHLVHLLHINSCGGEQHLAKSLVSRILILLIELEITVRHNLAHKAESVGVDS